MKSGDKINKGLPITLLALLAMLVVACEGGSGPDSNTVVIKLNQASPYFLQALSYSVSYVVEKKIIVQWGLKWTDHLTDNGGQGGAGPFMVSSYNQTKGINLVPNPNYYGPKPQLMKLKFFFYESPKVHYEVYQAGQLDETAIPTDNYAQASMRPDFSKNPDLMISYYSMNYLIKPFDNIYIRQAFELAIKNDAAWLPLWQDETARLLKPYVVGRVYNDLELVPPDD